MLFLSFSSLFCPFFGSRFCVNIACSLSHTVVVIGFESSLESVNESGEALLANVRILHGALDRSVVVRCISEDGEASEGLVSLNAFH